MKILEIKNDKVKFNSKKENEVLIDVFLRKSFNELTQLGLALDFDEMKKDESWRDYIECKLKVLMGVDNGKCFSGELEVFYKINILDRFLEKKGFNQFNMDEEFILSKLNLREYISNSLSNNLDLNFKQNKIKLEGLDFLKIIKGFIFMAGDVNTKGYYNLYVLKYRLPLDDVDNDIIHVIGSYDIIYVKLEEYRKKNDNQFLEEVANFLISKIDLTQDIQEVKVEQKIELSDEKTREIFEISDNNEDVDISS